MLACLEGLRVIGGLGCVRGALWVGRVGAGTWRLFFFFFKSEFVFRSVYEEAQRRSRRVRNVNMRVR